MNDHGTRGRTHRQASEPAPFRSLCSPLGDPPQHPLDDCLSQLVARLQLEPDSASRPRSPQALGEVAALIQSAWSDNLPLDYHCVLRCLKDGVADAIAGREGTRIPSLAADYAALVEIISRSHPSLDYRDTIVLLLELMTDLFKQGDIVWRKIHLHLSAIAKCPNAAKPLAGILDADIHQWFHAGIRDLTSYRKRLVNLIAELTVRVEDCERQRAIETAMLSSLETHGRSNIHLFEAKRRQRIIADVELELNEALTELARQRQTLSLLDADAKDFQERLSGARRACILRAV